MGNTFKQLQAQAFTLAGVGSSIGDITLVLSTMTTIDGTPITTAMIGSKGYFTLEPGNGKQEETGTFTGITQNANGTATLTGVSHQMFEDPYTETSGLTKSHSGGVNLILSNTAGYYQGFLRLGDSNTVADVLTFTAPNYPQIDVAATLPTLDAQFATKKYVDGVAIAGAPNASSTVKGISKLSSDPSVPTNPVALNSEEVSATSGANKVVRAKSNGKIDQGFLDLTESFNFSGNVTGITKFGGTGADGALVISSGTTTIDLGGLAYFEKNYSSISITGTGNLNFTNKHTNGTIIVLKSNGNVVITSSTVPAIDVSGIGGSGGGSNANGNFGNSVINISNPGGPSVASAAGKGGINYSPVSNAIFYRNIPLSCGGGGAGGNNNGAGTGGAGGGALMIECVGNLTLSSTIYNKGISGVNGSGSGSNNLGAGGGGASAIGNGVDGQASDGSNYLSTSGGGGGGGSTIILVKGTIANSGTLTNTGGTGGVGGGRNGGAGADGYKYVGNAIIN